MVCNLLSPKIPDVEVLTVCDVVIKWWNLSEAESSRRKIGYSQIRLERDIGTTPLSWPPGAMGECSYTL